MRRPVAARPSSCAICVDRPPTVYRQLEGDDFSCWICSECDGESIAPARPRRDRGYEVPERSVRSGSTLEQFRTGSALVAPATSPRVPYIGRDPTPGFLLVKVPRSRARVPIDRRQALDTLSGKPWFAEVRYVGCDVRWYVFERPDDKLSAAARRAPTYDVTEALKQMSSTSREREYQADRRDAARAAGSCINETNAGTHGMATDGVRCATCAATHRRSA